MTDDYLNRFSGIARLYGSSALHAFSQSHVMVIGLGGVGSWAVEALARSGIGTFTLVDLDDLCLTNINRQIHATTGSIGQSKAVVLAQRIAEISPEAQCHIQGCFYSEKSSADLLATPPDLILDAIDSVRAKCHLIATCRDRQIPLIVSGGAGGRIDPTQIQTADLAKTHGDALLLAVRQKLRREYHFPKAEQKSRPFRIPAVFSPEPPRFPTCEGETSPQRPTHLAPGLKCDAGYGAVTTVTATFGNLMAAWALKTLSSQKL